MYIERYRKRKVGEPLAESAGADYHFHSFFFLNIILARIQLHIYQTAAPHQTECVRETQDTLCLVKNSVSRIQQRVIAVLNG